MFTLFTNKDPGPLSRRVPSSSQSSRIIRGRLTWKDDLSAVFSVRFVQVVVASLPPQGKNQSLETSWALAFVNVNSELFKLIITSRSRFRYLQSQKPFCGNSSLGSWPCSCSLSHSAGTHPVIWMPRPFWEKRQFHVFVPGRIWNQSPIQSEESDPHDGLDNHLNAMETRYRSCVFSCVSNPAGQDNGMALTGIPKLPYQNTDYATCSFLTSGTLLPIDQSETEHGTRRYQI